MIITAIKLKQEGLVERVGILDLDMHVGDGTDELIRTHGLDFVLHLSQGKLFRQRSDVGRDAQHYFNWLRYALARMRKKDILLCQASADAHVSDPLGGLLTTQELLRRDQMIFEVYNTRVVVWNLAGGYQTDPWGRPEPVLRLHRNTLLACQRSAKAYDEAIRNYRHWSDGTDYLLP